MRTSRQLLLATLPFAKEQRWRSWWHLGTTVAVMAAATAVNLSEIHWALRIPTCLIAGLTLVRFFVLYHDHQHGSILSKSRFANLVMTSYGLLFLNPGSVWRRSHNHHHANNSRTTGPNVGSFPLMTVDGYQAAPPAQRWAYFIQRHTLTIACGYLTVFMFRMCLFPLFVNPRRHLDAALSVAVHGLLLLGVSLGGADDLLLAVLFPCILGSAVGAYLFYAQHNFPAVQLRLGSDWDMVSAALRSSSYFRMNPVMHWFTGNIGYHHVHHLNSHIPFYRLPEAMAALSELQNPGQTTFHPADVRACLRLKLWDPQTGQLVPWTGGQERGEARRAS